MASSSSIPQRFTTEQVLERLKLKRGQEMKNRAKSFHFRKKADSQSFEEATFPNWKWRGPVRCAGIDDVTMTQAVTPAGEVRSSAR
ncbi:hypothetical protein ACOMHN_041724 [Nucella lapillus]